MSDIVIREYKNNDWLDVSNIHDKARPVELDGSCDEKAFVPLATDKKDLENFTSSKKFVACANNEIIGFVGLIEHEITWLYVEPGESRKGIGRLLLQYALNIMEAKATTYVLEGNKAARSLYHSEGFNVEGTFNSTNNGYPCVVLKLTQ
ncbi:ribosomal protein S18 acetylase RimI-like enzyme [Sinobacterium caligoides]|uniref:Ribosomal protein S18 acetylase RimI-like enzyme n=1 Tax=Sinobacterium caligoides TaxID=933926 RepID=A0A3N2DZW9_9GAMM|nr:GNAT family N-acetyltransferase [Sinobacterium caligoides]ROS05390.1 ribosomal protein S18 acetylase RimI-like enzyme [Sinobacterium caligoides]